MGQPGAASKLFGLLEQRSEEFNLTEEYIPAFRSTRYTWAGITGDCTLDIGDEEYRYIPEANLDLLADAIMEEVHKKFEGLPDSEVPAVHD